SPRFHVYVSIIGVANKGVSALLQFLINIIEQKIRKQRRKWSALGRTLVPIHHYPFGHDSGLKIAANEPKHSLVLDSLGQLSHQHIVIDAVEKFLEVNVNHPSASFLNVSLRRAHRLMRTSPGSDTI